MERLTDMKYTRLTLAAAIASVVSFGCSGDQPSIGRDASGATPVETVAPEPIDATGTGEDGIEPVIADGDATSIAASYVFTFADGLTLPTNDVGYVYRANAPVDEAALTSVANYFGVEPDAVVDWDQDAITEDSPTVGMGYTASDPLQTWSYFDSAASASLIECTSVTGDAADSGTVPPDAPTDPEACASPAEPADAVPDATAAEATMSEMLTAIGVDPGTVEMRSYADPFASTVDATELDADGIPTGRTWSLGLGGGGVPYAASGPLAVPQPVGPYPLVDLDIATSRLGGGWAGGAVQGGGGADTATPADESAGTVAGTVPADAKAPVEPGGIKPPTAESVEIIAVEPDRVWLWDANNDAWMVPGYRFVDAEGSRWSVPAIAEDLLGAPGSTGGSTGGSPGTTPQDAGKPTEDDVTEPTLAPDASEALTPLLGSATLAEFTATADSFGLAVRVSTIDGQAQALTMDYNEARVNVSVSTPADGNLDDSIVTAIDSVG